MGIPHAHGEFVDTAGDESGEEGDRDAGDAEAGEGAWGERLYTTEEEMSKWYRMALELTRWSARDRRWFWEQCTPEERRCLGMPIK